MANLNKQTENSVFPQPSILNADSQKIDEAHKMLTLGYYVQADTIFINVDPTDPARVDKLNMALEEVTTYKEIITAKWATHDYKDDESKAINSVISKQADNNLGEKAGYRIEGDTLNILAHPDDPDVANKLSNALNETINNPNITSTALRHPPESYDANSQILIGQTIGWADGRNNLYRDTAVGYGIQGNTLNILAHPDDPDVANKLTQALNETINNPNITSTALRYPPESYDANSQILIGQTIGWSDGRNNLYRDTAIGYGIQGNVLNILAHPDDPEVANKLSNALNETINNPNITGAALRYPPESYDANAQILIGQTIGWADGRNNLYRDTAIGYGIQGNTLNILAHPDDPDVANKLTNALNETINNPNITGTALRYPPESYDANSQILIGQAQEWTQRRGIAYAEMAAMEQQQAEGEPEAAMSVSLDVAKEQELSADTASIPEEQGRDKPNEPVVAVLPEGETNPELSADTASVPEEQKRDKPNESVVAALPESETDPEPSADTASVPEEQKPEDKSRTGADFLADFKEQLKDAGKAAVRVANVQQDELAALSGAVKELNTSKLDNSGITVDFKAIETLHLENPKFSVFNDLDAALKVNAEKKDAQPTETEKNGLQQTKVQHLKVSFNDNPNDREIVSKKRAFLDNFKIADDLNINKITLAGNLITIGNVEKVAAANKNIKINWENTSVGKVDKKALTDLIKKHDNLTIKANGMLGMQLRFAAAKRDLQNMFNKITDKKEAPILTQKPIVHARPQSDPSAKKKLGSDSAKKSFLQRAKSEIWPKKDRRSEADKNPPTPNQRRP